MEVSEIEYFKQQDGLTLSDRFSFSNQYDLLQDLPIYKDIFPDRRVPKWDNVIVDFTMITLGNPRSGKDHYIRSTLKQIKQYYGDIDIHYEYDDLFNSYEVINEKPIQCIVVPDMTNLFDTYSGSDKSKLIQNHVKRRHLKKEHVRKGLLFYIYGVHRLYGLPPAWSTQWNLLNLRSYPKNLNDISTMKEYFTHDGLTLMKDIQAMRVKDKFYTGYSITLSETQLKFDYNPLITDDIL